MRGMHSGGMSNRGYTLTAANARCHEQSGSEDRPDLCSNPSHPVARLLLSAASQGCRTALPLSAASGAAAAASPALAGERWHLPSPAKWKAPACTPATRLQICGRLSPLPHLGEAALQLSQALV